MAEPPLFTSQVLSAHHRTSRFDCGVPALDRWLVTTALHAQAARTAQTFVWTSQSEPGEVVAYYSLSAHAVRRVDVPTQVGGRLGESVPAALIGKLALDKSLQSRGCGGVLVVDALERILAASHSGPAVKLVLVHAHSDHAKRMYRGYGFSELPASANAMALKLEAFAKAQERISRS